MAAFFEFRDNPRLFDLFLKNLNAESNGWLDPM